MRGVRSLLFCVLEAPSWDLEGHTALWHSCLHWCCSNPQDCWTLPPPLTLRTVFVGMSRGYPLRQSPLLCPMSSSVS